MIMDDIYITMEHVEGCVINITNLNQPAARYNLLNIMFNALYFNYRKLNYHKLLSGLIEFSKVFQQQKHINNWFEYQDLLSKYQLNLMIGNKIKNYIKSYEPELCFTNFQAKLEYIFQKFNKESQIKFKKQSIEFEKHFFQELIQHMLKYRLQNSHNEDQFINTYLLTQNRVETAALKFYIKSYLQSAQERQVKTNLA